MESATLSIKEAGFVHSNGIIKSPLDPREYKALHLMNGLRVLLISDPSTEQSAASLSVQIGYWADPDNLPGLAHFCEHMLFLGTEKYPEENNYSEYLSSHGGHSNAFTSAEATTYFFELRHEFLEGALDRFAQFFIAPLFTSSATTREMQAVDSENKKNLQQDVWRQGQLSRHLASREHPMHKFGTGNLETLGTKPTEAGVDVRDALLKFHEKYYSANQMQLVIIGREDLATLEEWAESKFSGARNNNRGVVQFNGTPYTSSALATRTQILPVKDLRQLHMFWYFPNLAQFYRKKPETYLGHLLGHEGPGSILATLKKLSYATALLAGADLNARDFLTFKVRIDLTEQGLEHVDEIVTIVFQYINMLVEAGPQEWIWEESAKLDFMQFLFKDKERPGNLVPGLSLAMLQPLTDEWLIAGNQIHDQFDGPLIDSLLKILADPSKMRIEIVAKGVEVDQVEPWYGTSYSNKPIAESLLKLWAAPGKNPTLALPPINEFVPTDFVLKAPPIEIRESKNIPPELISENQFAIWHKLDTSFKVPKTNAFFEIQTPFVYSTPRNNVLASIYVKMVMSSLNEYSYAADLAGLQFKLDACQAGLQLMLHGFSHKLLILAENIIARLADYKTVLDSGAAKFGVYRDKVERFYRSYMKSAAHVLASYSVQQAIEMHRWHVEQFVDEIGKVTIEDLQAFVPQMLSRLNYKILFHGNIDKQEALSIKELISKHLKAEPLKSGEKPSQRFCKLPKQSVAFCERSNPVLGDKNNAITNVYQIGRTSYKKRAHTDLLNRIVSEPLFNVLRTQEQLGYLLGSKTKLDVGVLSWHVIVQSERSPSYLDARIEAFIATIPTMIKELPEEKFREFVEAVRAVKSEDDKNLMEQGMRFWEEIMNDSYRFLRLTAEAAVLKDLTKEDLLQFFAKYVCRDAQERRKLSSRIAVIEQEEENKEKAETKVEEEKFHETKPIVNVADFAKFKATLMVYPYPAHEVEPPVIIRKEENVKEKEKEEEEVAEAQPTSSLLAGVKLRKIERGDADAKQKEALAEALELERRQNARLRAVDMESWYDRLKDYTFPTVFVPLSPDDARALIKQYWVWKRADVDVDTANVTLPPNFDRLKEDIARAMSTLGGSAVFAKLSSRSPKDSKMCEKRALLAIQKRLEGSKADANTIVATVMAEAIRSLKMTSAEEVLKCFLTSDRVCEDDLPLALNFPDKWTQHVVLREWVDIPTSNEFRGFVLDGKLNGISQYFSGTLFESLLSNKAKLQALMQQFFLDIRAKIAEGLDPEDYVIDFGIDAAMSRVYVIELNPFGRPDGMGTGTCLFHRSDAKDMAILFGESPFEFRIDTQPATEEHLRKLMRPGPLRAWLIDNHFLTA